MYKIECYSINSNDNYAVSCEWIRLDCVSSIGILKWGDKRRCLVRMMNGDEFEVNLETAEHLYKIIPDVVLDNLPSGFIRGTKIDMNGPMFSMRNEAIKQKNEKLEKDFIANGGTL